MARRVLVQEREAETESRSQAGDGVFFPSDELEMTLLAEQARVDFDGVLGSIAERSALWRYEALKRIAQEFSQPEF